jgi:hypothetical protein
MALSQARVIAILDAANDTLNKLIELRHAIRDAQGAVDRDTALERLWEQLSMCEPRTDFTRLIAEETAHFRRVRHKNNKDAARLRASRGTATPDDTAFIAARRRPAPSPHGGSTIPLPSAEPAIPSCGLKPHERAALQAELDALYPPGVDYSSPIPDTAEPSAPISPPAPTRAGADTIRTADGEEWEFPPDDE